jgi:hypothetical protein
MDQSAFRTDPSLRFLPDPVLSSICGVVGSTKPPPTREHQLIYVMNNANLVKNRWQIIPRLQGRPELVEKLMIIMPKKVCQSKNLHHHTLHTPLVANDV